VNGLPTGGLRLDAALEVRAGSPLGKRLLFPDLTDPAGLWKKK